VSKFMKIRPVDPSSESRVVSCERTDGRSDRHMPWKN